MSKFCVPALYKRLIDTVIESAREDFENYGVDESVLEELRLSWERRIFRGDGSVICGMPTGIPFGNNPRNAPPPPLPAPLGGGAGAIVGVGSAAYGVARPNVGEGGSASGAAMAYSNQYAHGADSLPQYDGPSDGAPRPGDFSHLLFSRPAGNYQSSDDEDEDEDDEDHVNDEDDEEHEDDEVVDEDEDDDDEDADNSGRRADTNSSGASANASARAGGSDGTGAYGEDYDEGDDGDEEDEYGARIAQAASGRGGENAAGPERQAPRSRSPDKPNTTPAGSKLIRDALHYTSAAPMTANAPSSAATLPVVLAASVTAPALAAPPAPTHHIAGGDEDELNSDLDDSDAESLADRDTEFVDTMLCLYEKVTRTKNKWKCVLRDGIVNINGTEYLFNRATGEFQF